MAFNLDKTDQPAYKFNLSKSDESPVTKENKNNSGKSIWIIIALVVIGSVAWYLFRPAAENFATAVPAASQDSPVAGGSPTMASAGRDSVATTATATAPHKPENKNVAVENDIKALQNSVPGSFDPDSYSLHADETVIHELVDFLSKNRGKKIIIKGYASSEGDLAVNRQLSGRRAISFKEYLVSKGIAADRITTEAKGIENPVATNDTGEGRSKNRRVQVTIAD